MTQTPHFSLNVHGPVISVEAVPDNGGQITLNFGGYPRVTIFTGNAAMSAELADAVNAVLAKHRQPIAEAAE